MIVGRNCLIKVIHSSPKSSVTSTKFSETSDSTVLRVGTQCLSIATGRTQYRRFWFSRDKRTFTAARYEGGCEKENSKCHWLRYGRYVWWCVDSERMTEPQNEWMWESKYKVPELYFVVHNWVRKLKAIRYWYGYRHAANVSSHQPTIEHSQLSFAVPSLIAWTFFLQLSYTCVLTIVKIAWNILVDCFSSE